MSMKAYRSIKFMGMLRLFLKLLVSIAWVIVLSVCFVHTWENPTGLIKNVQNVLGSSWKNPSLYITAVAIYLLPNALAAVLFVFPLMRRWIENSNWRIVRLLLWWSQVRIEICKSCLPHVQLLFVMLVFWFECGAPVPHSVLNMDDKFCFVLQPRLYIGRGMHESQWTLFK